MSTSKTYQQSLADAGSETRPPMLERGSYIPWASRFRRYINQKRENQKWLNKALDEGPYQFEMFIPNNSTVSKLQTAEDLQGDALLHYDAEMELMNLILLSIPNDIYNSVHESWVHRSRNTSSYYVTHPTSVVDYKDEYQQDYVHTNLEDPLTSAMLKHFNLFNATNCKWKRGHNARNCPKPRVLDLKNFHGTKCLQQAKQDEVGVILTYEQNDFLFADASRMEEIEELGANICLMARIQPADNTF
ncbi:hypothetical protein Tco_0445812 [Tanacetum coccineum]